MNLDFARTESPDVKHGSVRNVMQDFQSPGSFSKGPEGRLCRLCRRTIPLSEHTGSMYCKRCSKEHEQRIADHRERVSREMANVGHSH